MKTFSPKSSETTRNWHLFDAKDEILGRLANRIAVILMGKNKPTYAPHVDSGDNIVVVNAKEIKITGRKSEQKVYRHHSGYPGGMKVMKYLEVQSSKPEQIILHAVSGMLPKNKLHDRRLKHLHIYSGTEHPYYKQFKQSNA